MLSDKIIELFEKHASHVRQAYCVETNSDLSEGRGQQYAKHICELEATAKRLSSRAGIQGSDAEIIKRPLFYIDNCWYGPVKIEVPTEEDRKQEMFLRIEKEKQERFKAIITELEEKGIDRGKIDFLLSYK